MKINELYIGQEYRDSRTFTNVDVKQFAQVTNDYNPIHLDEEYASKSIFKKNIVHGFLTGSMISAIIGTKFPGEGSIYLSQTMNFRAPVYYGDTITTVVSVKNIKIEKSIVYLNTNCYNQNEIVVLEGEAIVKL